MILSAQLRLSGLQGALPYLGGCRLVTNQSDWIILYGWEQIEIVRGDFPSHISRSDESIYWWPLFIWECRLNLMIGIDEMLGRVLGRGAVPSGQGPGSFLPGFLLSFFTWAFGW